MSWPSALRCLWLLGLIGFALCYLLYLYLFLAVRDTKELQLPQLLGPSTAFSHRKFHQPVGHSKWMKNRVMNDSTPLSNWLLSPEDSPPPAKTCNRSNPFLILIWEHGPFLERRHLRRFSRNKKFSPWENCSVNNCRLTYKSEDLYLADAVVFHLHRTARADLLPRRENPNQRWIFLSDESPLNTFLYRGQSISDYNGLFNWSMTYRMNSDIPVPYGRTILSSVNGIPDAFIARKRTADKLVAVLGSNCSGKNNRWSYIKQLKDALGDELQILGGCLDGNRTACPGHFDADCPVLEQFKFYLAFENSNCREYLSEKVFWNAYEKLAVPVIMGAPRSDCERLLPPESFLHVEDFANPASLASFLLYLDRNEREYAKLHAWRSSYRVLNEHGYFGSASRHYCRLCEALNYNSPADKVYDDLQDFWNQERDCNSPAS